jgi:hypothetical protein
MYIFFLLENKPLDQIFKCSTQKDNTNEYDSKKRCVINCNKMYDHNGMMIIRVEDTYLPSVTEFVRTTKLEYIVMSSNSSIIEKMVRIKVRCFYHPPDQLDVMKYINICLKIIRCPTIPVFGFTVCSHKKSAGILPLIWHKGMLYCMLGLDKYRNCLSDFGGKHDHQHVEHKNNQSFKNKILGDRQIHKGMIDLNILADQMISSGGKIGNIKDMMGCGDLNSKYTAFRELIEETTQRDNHTTSCIFDVATIYHKLYVQKKYIYLGGDTDDQPYDYDMYLIFLTTTDFDLSVKKILDSMTERYAKNRSDGADLVDCLSDIKENYTFPILGNKEMSGVSVVPLNHLIDGRNDGLKKRNRINRNRHIMHCDWRSDNVGRLYGDYRDMCDPHNCQDKNKNIINFMRPCFVEAFDRYIEEFKFLQCHFEIAKEILI